MRATLLTGRQVFERYNERARRVIFFARYEASLFGSRYIETEHLLLGLMREDAKLRTQLLASGSDRESLRKEIESQRPVSEKISTSVDLPLSHESKRVLAYASEEAESLAHNVIDSGHLVLGLLRIENCLAAGLLERHGISYEGYREIVRAAGPPSRENRPAARESAWRELEGKEPAAPCLGCVITRLKTLLNRALDLLNTSSEVYGRQQLKRKPWSRKQALGHLIDLATAHHQWLARALVEPRLTIAAYPQEDWVAAQQYQEFSWPDTVDLWMRLNHLLMHVLLLIPEEKVNLGCRIGIEEPIPLLKLIERYIATCDDMFGQILSRLD